MQSPLEFLDVLIIAIFVGYAFYSGLKQKGIASKNLEEYFLAGRTLPGWKAGMSMAATQFAADTPLLVTGLIATAGIFSLWQLWIYALAFLLMGFLLAAQWRRAGVLTDAELTEIRYGEKPAAVLRGVKAVYFGTLFNCTVLAWVFFAAAKIAEPFLLWNLWLPEFLFQPFVGLMEWVGISLASTDLEGTEVWVRSANNFLSVLFVVGVTIFYSTTGGLRSVVATDVFQLLLMLLGSLFYTWIVVDKAGGLGSIYDQINSFGSAGPNGMTADQILAFTPSHAKDASFAVLSVFALQWLIQLNSDGTGYLAQRTMACRSEKDAKIAAVVFTFLQVFLRSLIWIPLGLALLLIFPHDPALTGVALQADREGTFVRGISELLPVGLRGLMLTGMLAALASTVDTHLNWGSSYWTNDIYKRFICQSLLKKTPSDRSLVWVARFSNLLIFALAVLIMTQLDSIQQAWQMSLLLGAGMGVTLILRWLWWRMNAWAEISAIVSSLFLSPILLSSVESQALRLLLIAIVSTAFALFAVFWFGPEKKERLQDFHRKVRPLGFWGPFSTEPQRDRKRFFRALWTTSIAAFSLFSLLTGVGSWLVGSAEPTWFPFGWTSWVFILLLTGLGLTPVWIKLGFSDTESE